MKTRKHPDLPLVVAIAALALALPANADTVPIVDVYGHNEKDNYAGKINDGIIGPR